jgi:hypothetical protein
MRTRLLSSGLAALAGLLLGAQRAFAEEIPAVICNGLIGCGAGPRNLVLEGVVPAAGLILIQLAGGLAVIFIVLAGVKMVVSGAEDDGGAAKKAIIYGLGGLGLAISAAPIVSFVTSENYADAGGDMLLIGVMAAVIRIILTVFNVIFVVVIIYAGTRMAMSMGSGDEFKKGTSMVKWAVIGAITVNLARAIVQALLNIGI